ncbi:MAG: hypothetical protein FVQ85_00150 [Planctomycetes bacterium]|nr:hypothetical protein [Planctomycetota bacterium]
MAEIKKTLTILKARWPEVTLIIGLYALAVLSNNLSRATRPDLTKTLFLLRIPFSLFSLTLMVVSMILNYGFLRTVHLEGQKVQTPMALLKTGRHFFWRMVGFGLIYIVPYFILAWLIFLIIKYFTFIDTGFLETAKVAPWLYQLCSIAPMLILIKVVLFIPALIIVLDCGVFKSFKFLRKCKLLDSRELVALFCLRMVLPFLWIFLQIPYNPATSSQYILRIVSSIIGQFIGLIISVMAVRFVASLHLVYDNQPSSLDFEDSRK